MPERYPLILEKDDSRPVDADSCVTLDRRIESDALMDVLLESNSGDVVLSTFGIGHSPLRFHSAKREARLGGQVEIIKEEGELCYSREKHLPCTSGIMSSTASATRVRAFLFRSG